MIIYTYAKKGQIVPDWNVPEKYKLVVFCAKEVEVPKTWYKSIVKPLIDDEEVIKNIHKMLPHRKIRDATFFVDLDKNIKQNFIVSVNIHIAEIQTTHDMSWISRPYNQSIILFNELWLNNYKYVTKDVVSAFKETTKYMDIKPTYIDSSLVYY